MFYVFHQNNSFGTFERKFGFACFVEAASPEEANRRAEEFGIYFDGVKNDKDCPCCGDRFSRAREVFLDLAAVRIEMQVWADSAQHYDLPFVVLFDSSVQEFFV